MHDKTCSSSVNEINHLAGTIQKSKLEEMTFDRCGQTACPGKIISWLYIDHSIHCLARGNPSIQVICMCHRKELTSVELCRCGYNYILTMSLV